MASSKKGRSRRSASNGIFGGSKTNGKLEALELKEGRDASAWLYVTMPLDIASLKESKLGNENTGIKLWFLETSDVEKEIDETEEETGCVNAWSSIAGGEGIVAGWEGADGESDGDASFPVCLAASKAIKPSSFSSISATRLFDDLAMRYYWVFEPRTHSLEFFARLGRGFAASNIHGCPSLRHL